MSEDIKPPSTRPGGWAWPLNVRKAHYFAEGEAISLCGKIMYLGSQREAGNEDSPDNCATCRRRRITNIERARARPSSGDATGKESNDG